MGYMSISLHGSDMASDACARVTQMMVTELRKELDNPANEYNTPGPVNVALFFEERIIPGGFAEDYSGALIKLAEDTLSSLEGAYVSAEKAEWDDECAKLNHMNAFKRLINSLKSFIADSTLIDSAAN